MNSEDITQQICQKYIENCENIKHTPNKSLVSTLSNPEQGQEALDFIFRGNDKSNFTSRIKDKDLIILAECIIDYGEGVRNIDLSYNEIGDSGAEALANLLQHCQNIESLNLQGNSIETIGGQAIAQSLKENYSLRFFNIQGNKIKTDGAMNIIEILFSNKNLLELNLADNEINHDGMIGLTSVMNWNNNTLQILNVDKPVYTSIGQETAIHFAKMLQSNRSIEKLSLQKHMFTCDAIYTITEHLLENNRLRVLDLTANKISFKGCEALGKYLCGEYCVLESLVLASNRTGHYGAKAISQALSKNRTLIHLDMTNNDIDDNGLRMIAESLETNEYLVSLKLYNNHFGQLALQEFHKLRTRQRKGDWFWDFHTYIVDNHIEMAYIETLVPYDIKVSNPYYYQ